MAMVQWFNVAARRVVSSAAEQRMVFSSLASSMGSSSPVDTILCGRGDKRTKKGKRFKGSNGVSRPKRDKKIERIKDRIEVPRSTPWPLPFKLI